MLPNNLYDFLKWFAIAGIPTLGLAYSKLSITWGLPFGDQVQDTLEIIGAVLAAFLMWKNYQFKKDFDIYTAPKAQPDSTPVYLEDNEEEAE